MSDPNQNPTLSPAQNLAQNPAQGSLEDSANGLDVSIDELRDRLVKCSTELDLIKSEQDRSSKLLIRRDLALSRANEQLLVLDRSKSEFISVAAHQLRTPLSAIKWILHMVINNEFKDDAEKAEFLDKAANSTDRLIDLVNDLLEVDHIQSGKDQFVFSAISLSPIITSVVADLMPLVEKSGLHIVATDLVGVNVVGDSDKLRAVFQNLIENAVKYNRKDGTITVRTVVGEEGGKRQLRATVTDTGIGIPENQSGRIFSKFFRAPNALKVDTVGSGLGLFIVKQIVERHGGKIWFESKTGEGTTFIVTLPLAGDKV